jgi:hypothetical protein
MSPKAWSKKRERQYGHIKDGLIERGEDPEKAEEIAARTVSKTRAQAGEAKESSKLSREDIPSSRRGGLRARGGPKGRTYDQLYQEARKLNVEGRSKMSKEQLRKAVDSKK